MKELIIMLAMVCGIITIAFVFCIFTYIVVRMATIAYYKTKFEIRKTNTGDKPNENPT